MADTPLDKLVEEYLQELPRVLAAWSRYVEGVREGWFLIDRATETAAYDAAVARFVPISEDVEKGAAVRGLKSSTAPLTILRSRLEQRAGVGPQERQAAIEAAELIRIESMHGRAVKKQKRKPAKEKTVEERMHETIALNPDSCRWSSRKWGKHLHCAHSSVDETDLYKSDALTDQRKLDEAERRAMKHMRTLPRNM